MALAGRNDPCPCGSGRKYKRCCGFDRVTERTLEDRLAATKEIARLAYGSAQLVPASDAYDAWVRAVLAGDVGPSVEAAIATLDRNEVERIVRTCYTRHATRWPELVSRCGGERDAVAALLGGAVAAGIRDHRPVERTIVELVEESDDLPGDSFEALALCLDGAQLWDAEDGLEAERAIDAIPDWVDDDAYERRWHEVLELIAASRTTDWHGRRLARLVERIERQLPFDGFPRASAAIQAGCEQFAAEERFRRRLAATLLGDMVGSDSLRELRTLFAA